MYNRLDRIPACDRQMDGRRDGDILPRHSPRYAYASRGKNEMLIQDSARMHDRPIT